jgi:hypothetical protein
MLITRETTVKNILDAFPDAIAIFASHGVDISLECDESILDSELELCESMCHIDDLPGLIQDLQKFVDSKKN